MAKQSKWHARPAKAQISLGIRTGYFVGFVMLQLKCKDCFQIIFFPINTNSNEWKFYADPFYVQNTASA